MDTHLILLILHVIGAGVIAGVVVFSLFLAFKKTWSAERLTVLHYISRFGMWASLWQLVTGILLVSSEWDEFSGSGLFWTKMALYVIEGTLASRLIDKKAKQLREGDSASGFSVAVAIHAALIIGIISIGVILVSGGETH